MVISIIYIGIGIVTNDIIRPFVILFNSILVIFNMMLIITGLLALLWSFLGCFNPMINVCEPIVLQIYSLITLISGIFLINHLYNIFDWTERIEEKFKR
jgi:hypothetical protein